MNKPAWREWVESLAIAFILAMFIRTFFIQAFRIPSGSMEPTLQIQDRLMVNKLRLGPKIPFTHKRIPGYGQLHRGDIIVFVYPGEPKKDFIKRLIAFGGERVEIRFGDVYINDQIVEDPRIRNIYYYNYGPYAQPGAAIEVPPGHLFVLGDNSKSSHDSRYWGFVPVENVIGNASVIYFPFTRMRFIR